MKRRHRRWWWVFGACAAAATGAMSWLTLTVLDLERSATASTRHQAAVRLALWRMDSWLSPVLAREAARPYFEYQSFYAQQKAYSRILSEIEPGEVLAPSPLLTFRSELIPLHFQIDPRGTVTSPQVPTGNHRDLAEANWASLPFRENTSRLRELQPRLDSVRLTRCVQELETAVATGPPPVNAREPLSNEFQRRSEVSQAATSWTQGPPAAASVRPGPFVATWLPSAPGLELAFVRRVQVIDTVLIQGFLVDWTRLQSALLAQAQDLFSDRTLALSPQPESTSEAEDRKLATVPAVLDAGAPAPVDIGWSPARTVLAAAWLALLVAGAAIGFTLHSAITLGERQTRFASAVTHELRTPLTTFRMYSEMLADDMVQGEAQRARYLDTLQREAGRLSRLVENVLCYARLEEGRYHGQSARVTTDDLLARVLPALEQRASQARLELAVTRPDPAVTVETDADAIDQILFNLVDNAAKYAGGAGDRRIEIELRASDRDLRISVRDHGPGIAPRHANRVFTAFERADRTAGDNITPGVGLGLALCRGLADDLGATLELDPAVRDGACFVLRVPMARSR